MRPHQPAFVRAALACGALRFDGPFRLKSGRMSPYFFDTSRFSTGSLILALAEAYVRTLFAAVGEHRPDVLFGPAYKGVPLAVACAAQWKLIYGYDVGFLFDRKEAKQHGEHSAEAATSQAEARKRLVGHRLEDGMRVVLLDDVLTTGGTKQEACALLHQAAPGARITALVVALDRQELGPGGRTATEEFTARTGIPVYTVMTASDLAEVLRSEKLAEPETVERLERYLAGGA